jgi:hypothetical protein
MCKHGTDKEITITQVIKVDACIADEIAFLNANGVRTENSCCGHGNYHASALILPSSLRRAEGMGYKVTAMVGGLYEIELKSENRKEDE